jgi:hypothetical protein
MLQASTTEELGKTYSELVGLVQPHIHLRCKACKHQFDITPGIAEPGDLLPQPATVIFERQRWALDFLTAVPLGLPLMVNGIMIMGLTKPGQLVFKTPVRYNTMMLVNSGGSVGPLYRFEATPGGTVVIKHKPRLSNTKFVDYPPPLPMPARYTPVGEDAALPSYKVPWRGKLRIAITVLAVAAAIGIPWTAFQIWGNSTSNQYEQERERTLQEMEQQQQRYEELKEQMEQNRATNQETLDNMNRLLEQEGAAGQTP